MKYLHNPVYAEQYMQGFLFILRDYDCRNFLWFTHSLFPKKIDQAKTNMWHEPYLTET